MDAKWLRTTQIFDEYERRFAAARAAKKLSSFPEDREKVLAGVKKMLCWKDELVPRAGDLQEQSRRDYVNYYTSECIFPTWQNFWGSATLFMPKTEEKVPLVFVCCGHGDEGRRTESYQAMGHRLASLGMAAIVMDNIGQGDRAKDPTVFKTEDHWFSLAPFYCGLTLQGMIVMETVGLIRKMAKDPRFSRLAACGNSGGGTLTMFLAAMAPELAVLSSSGYPSEVNYVLTKERRHCACNLLEGTAFGPEMWEIYSLFAPKPLLLEGGKHDNLIPLDLAHRNARKVKNTYMQLGSEEITFQLTDTRHSWALEDLNLISGFLSEKLLGVTPEPLTEVPAVETSPVTMPPEMLSTNALAEALTGKKMPENTRLCDIYVPQFEGKPVNPDQIQPDVGRGDVMRVFAQMECALKNSCP
ncbi:MAG: acetylxylan esterase [Oscillospiraceae bacterium]|nr:acetylxylan esterase [Oscillospiraceae bacterium]